jgi:hypothetical protein
MQPIPKKQLGELTEKNGPLVEEGIKDLTKANQLHPNDSDTMVYLNLMYRQKAEIDPDEESRQADLKSANEWMDKALEAKKTGGAAPSATPSS